MAHTPGPWTVDDCGVYSNDATGSIVARVSGRGLEFAPRPEEEWKANGRLVAAAPEMYEALKSLPLDAFDKDRVDIDAAEFVDHSVEFFEAIQKARAALAKVDPR